ncbi:MAG: cupin domain-containing protein [Pseudomonadota bacterium]
MTDLTGLTASLSDLENVHPLPGCTMRRFSGERVMLQEATMPKGAVFAPHSHHNEQLVIVLEGRVRLDVGDEATPVELGPGDLLRLPPHVPHGGEALEDCRLIDAFSPPRTTVLGEEEPQ